MNQKRRILLSIFVIVLTLMMTACQSNTIDQPTVTDTNAGTETNVVSGSFTGTASGFGGDIEVTLTIEGDRITDAKIVGDKETPNIGGLAIERMAKDIVEKNTIEVDAFTGATMTSNGVLEAAAKALEKSGLTVADLAKVETNKVVSQTEYETDILVIGAGGAGLTAANAAQEKGIKNIIVIEKMPYVGGATAQAGGFVGGGSKLQKALGLTGDSPDLIYEDIMRGGEYTNNPELVRLMADNMGETLDWLIEELNVPIYDRYPSDFPEHTVQRFFVVEGGTTGLTDTLADEFVKKGGTLLLETRATEFIMDGNSVAGAKAVDKDGNELTIKAKKTILATGGFGNNLDMLTADISNAVFYGVASSTGDGHKMAESIGAKMVFMEYAKLYPQGISLEGTNTGRADPTSCLTTTNNTGAIYVNKEGKRVVDENLDFVSIKKATMAQTDQIIFLVMDQTAFDMWSKLVNEYPSPAGRITYEEQEAWFNKGGKPIFTRGTLKEAAELAGIDADALAETVSNWNQMVKAGKDTEFGREELFELDTEGKFYIVEQRLRFATTLGGVDVNTKLEVKDKSDNIIPNLYAAGEVVGGANGIEAMPGCMLGWSVNSGRFAGYSAAEALLSE
jgi:flavocytochrome c